MCSNHIYFWLTKHISQAVLAMPFFTDNGWLSQMSRLWVWLALTIPSTGLAFGFYFYWRRRDQRGRPGHKEV